MTSPAWSTRRAASATASAPSRCSTAPTRGETSADNAEAAAAVADVPQFDYLATPLRRRKAFANAAGAGLSVLEARPADPKAVAEMQALVNAVSFNIDAR